MKDIKCPLKIKEKYKRRASSPERYSSSSDQGQKHKAYNIVNKDLNTLFTAASKICWDALEMNWDNMIPEGQVKNNLAEWQKDSSQLWCSFYFLKKVKGGSYLQGILLKPNWAILGDPYISPMLLRAGIIL